MENTVYSTIYSFLKNNENITILDVDKAITSFKIFPMFQGLSEENWLKVSKMLKSQFEITSEKGIEISKSSKNHDKKWWTEKIKDSDKNNSHYFNFYKNESKLPLLVLDTIDYDTDKIMNHLGNPCDESLESFNRYGMVIGNVQSGKTGNYSALIAKAADAGYKFIVVIAGGLNNLRNQTQKRLEESFINNQKVSELKPFSLTTLDADFNSKDANKLAKNFKIEMSKSPVVIVIKKNTSTLKSVKTWLEKTYKNKNQNDAMLIIDDESDYASINTKKAEDPTAINKGIRDILQLFYKSTYVAYTATPFANIFIDHEATNENHGKDLFPSDFIYVLDAPKNYFGVEKIFFDKNGETLEIDDSEHLIAIEDCTLKSGDIPISHKKDYSIKKIPESMKEAIRNFIINIAIRDLRGHDKKHNSMLIHATRFTQIHKYISMFVKAYLEQINQNFINYGKIDLEKTQNEIIQALKETFDKFYYNKIEFDWFKVQFKITDIVNDIESRVKIRQVHMEREEDLIYDDKSRLNTIVIGGNSLARGYTLEGLSVSYFLRNSIYYDTLMQMGRWFGYREGYEDLCKIYLKEEMIKNFAHIGSVLNELKRDLLEMNQNNKTPEEFGLMIRQNPISKDLQITALNKMKNTIDAYVEMNLFDKLVETKTISKDEKIKEINNQNLKNIIIKLRKQKIEEIDYGYLVKDVSNDIVKDFIKFYVHPKLENESFFNEFPTEFILEHIEKHKEIWDICLFSVKSASKVIIEGLEIGLTQRKFNMKDEDKNFSINVTGGEHEGVTLDDEIRSEIRSKKSGDRKKYRSLRKKPLLMIYCIGNSETQNSDEYFVAFGVSFQKNGEFDEKKAVKVKINTVKRKEYEEIMRSFEEE